MATLSRTQFDSFIQNTLPDNSTRQISASDLRQSFINLADSITVFNNDIYLSALNFGELESRSIYIGTSSLSRKDVNGFYSEDNTALGYSSLNVSYLSKRNTSLGSYSLACNSLGSDNVAVGFHSLGGITTGSGNIGIGNYTMMKNKHGQFNIIIGHGAGYNLPNDEDFKFILGAYPQASGDCDDLAEGLDNPPLLYGDLNSLQLAIGISGFRGSEKLSVSGHIYPYENAIFSLGHSDYKWDAYLNNLDINGTIKSTSPFHEFEIGANIGSDVSIASGDIINFNGVTGVDTIVSSVGATKIIKFSAAPVSGWAGGHIHAMVENSGYAVSGWADGHIHEMVEKSGYAVSGWADDYIYNASGALDSYIYSTSGWTHEDLNSISGYAPAFNGPSGLSWNVSGWARSYAETLSIAAGAYTHWVITDDFSNSDQVSEPGNPENTIKFKGISGIQAIYRTDNHSLEISAHPLSGWAFGTIEDYAYRSGYAVSGWADSHIHAMVENSGYAVSGWAGGHIHEMVEISGYAVSGWANDYIYSVSGWAHEDLNSISGYGSSFNGPSGLIWNVSGWNAAYSDHLDGLTRAKIETDDSKVGASLSGYAEYLVEISGYAVSGWADEHIHEMVENSGYAVSGWAHEDLNVISGYGPAFSGPSGLVWNVSGWARGYVDATNASSNAYTHWYITDGVDMQEIQAQEFLHLSGIEGISTNLITNLTSPAIEISAEPLSGVLDSFIDDVSGALNSYIYDASGSLDSYIYDASGALRSYTYDSSGLLYDFIEELSGVVRSEVVDITQPTAGIIDVRIRAERDNHVDPAINDLSDSIFEGPTSLSGTLYSTIELASGYTEDLGFLFSGVLQDGIQNLSGVMNHDFYDRNNGRLHNVSGSIVEFVNERFRKFTTDIQVGEYGEWRVVSDDNTAGFGVGLFETVKYLGKDGVTTSLTSAPLDENDRDVGPHVLTIDSAPLSGYINSVSGLLDSTLRTAITDSGIYYSGILHNIIDSSGVDLIDRINASGYAISGALDGYIYDASGALDSYVYDASGALDSYVYDASGALNDYAYDISGVSDRYTLEASGALDSYIDTVSGFLRSHTDSASGSLNNYIYNTSGTLYDTIGESGKYLYDLIQLVEVNNDNYLHWTISDGTTSRDIRALEITEFLGVSGIETVTKTVGSSGIYLSARPLSGVLSDTISHSGHAISGALDGYIYDASGALDSYVYDASGSLNNFAEALSGLVIHDLFGGQTSRGTGIINLGNLYTDEKVDSSGVDLINRINASGYAISGALDGYIYDASGALNSYIYDSSGALDSYIDMVSGYLNNYIVDNDSRASGLIDTNDTRASGYILAVSGSTITSAGSGLVRLDGGEFNTAGSGNFEKLILQKTDAGLLDPVGQILADSGDGYNVIVNSNGYLQMPAVSEYDDLPSASDYGNSGVAFVDSNVYHSDGVSWSKPLTIEGFMEEDLDHPTDFLNPMSGKLITRVIRDGVFQTGNTEYVTNRDHTFAASGGYYLMAMRVNNEYRPIWSTCSGCPACE